MKFSDALRGRRAVRDFRPDPVSRQVLTELAAAATQAPSYMNLQPWAYAIVDDAPAVARMGEQALRYLRASPREAEPFRLYRPGAELPTHSVFYNAPALIVVCATIDDRLADLSCAMAAHGLMLAAQTMGLGTCWISHAQPWLDAPAGRHALGLPAHYRVIAPIIVGGPSAEPVSPGRLKAEIHWVETTD